MPILRPGKRGNIVFANRQELIRESQNTLDRPDTDTSQAIEAWAMIGECHVVDQQSEQAEDAFLKAIALIRTMGDERFLAEGLENLGNAMQLCQAYQKAIKYYQQAIDIYIQLDETEKVVLSIGQVAYCHMELGEFDKERESLNRALTLSDNLLVIKGNLLERLARSFGSSKQYPEAISFFEQALSIYSEIGYQREWKRRVEALAQFYEAAGDKESAKRTLERVPPEI